MEMLLVALVFDAQALVLREGGLRSTGSDGELGRARISGGEMPPRA
jgi:hypothetical protein